MEYGKSEKGNYCGDLAQNLATQLYANQASN